MPTIKKGRNKWEIHAIQTKIRRFQTALQPIPTSPYATSTINSTESFIYSRGTFRVQFHMRFPTRGT